MKTIPKVLTLILLLFSILRINDFPALANTLNKSSIPDFCQGDTRYGILPGGGKPYCGPTAISNLLIYLDKNGFPNLLKKENPTLQDQFNLIKLLGTKYTKTSLETGTEPLSLMRGLEKYVKEKGYDISIQWKGWSSGSKHLIGKIPDQEWIKKEVGGLSNVILHIGWYKYDRKNDFYKRISGHYITVVDIKDNGIIVHDPAIRSGFDPKDEFCKFIPIKSGRLSKWHQYKERDASGYLKIEGIKIKEGTDTGIIDGAFVFRLFNKDDKSSKTIKYFAYGSNMSLKRMKERRVTILNRTHGILKDYELKFNKTSRSNPNEGKASIAPQKGRVVEGVLYEIKEAGLKNLDIFEGHPKHYNRILVIVALDNGNTEEAFTYIAQLKYSKNGLSPSREYLNYLLDGKEFLSKNYYNWLRSVKTID